MLTSLMRYISICALLLMIIMGCDKAKDVPQATYPVGWGMYGVVNNDSFKATSLFATTVRNNSGTHTIDISGWDNRTKKVVYIHLANASLTIPQKTYTFSPVTVPDAAKNYAYYQSRYKDYAHSGFVYIDSYIDSVLKGSYYFETTIGISVKGTFTIKPNS